METPRSPIPATPGAPESAQENPSFRTKTIATRITPEELRTVEAAAERNGKTLAVWLRELALEAAQERSADPTELILAELSALRYTLHNLFHASASAQSEGRYGNPVVLSLQGRSQMEKRYWQDAEAMLSQPATKIFLKTSEPRAAKWISDSIGEIEVERLKESRSMGLLRSKKSFAMEIATNRLSWLPRLRGLLPSLALSNWRTVLSPQSSAWPRKRASSRSFRNEGGRKRCRVRLM